MSTAILRFRHRLVLPAVLCLLFVLPAAGGDLPPNVEVVAGTGDVGDGLPATEVPLAGISGLAVDKAGNLYFADIGHNRIRRVDAETGRISTVAGTGGVEQGGYGQDREGRGGDHVFTPGALALDGEQKILYATEVAGKRILSVDLESGELKVVDGPRRGFTQPVGLMWSQEGLYVVDTVESKIWRRDREGNWETLVRSRGGLPGGVRGIARAADGDLYLSEFFGHRLVRWDAETGDLHPFAGTGVPGRSPDGTKAVDATIKTPDGVVVDGEGRVVFSDMNNRRILRIDPRVGELETLHRSGTGGLKWIPGKLTLDAEGNLWAGDLEENRVLRFRPGRSTPEVMAGGGSVGDGGPATRAFLSHPGRVQVDADGNLFISDAMQHRVRRVDARTGTISTVAGTGSPGYNGDDMPATQAKISYPGGLVLDGKGHLYLGDYYNNRVRRVDLESGRITTVAGNGYAGEDGDGGSALEATLLNPHALAMDGEGKVLITSAVSQSVRRFDPETGKIHRVALDEELVPSYRVLVFYGLAVADGGIYLADGMRNQLIHVRPGEEPGAKPEGRQVLGKPHLYYPMDVAVSPSGEVFICDSRNNRVLRMGSGEPEVVLDGLGRPRGITFDKEGNLYIADTFHNRVLRVKVKPVIDASAVVAGTLEGQGAL